MAGYGINTMADHLVNMNWFIFIDFVTHQQWNSERIRFDVTIFLNIQLNQ